MPYKDKEKQKARMKELNSKRRKPEACKPVNPEPVNPVCKPDVNPVSEPDVVNPERWRYTPGVLRPEHFPGVIGEDRDDLTRFKLRWPVNYDKYGRKFRELEPGENHWVRRIPKKDPLPKDMQNA